jgi:hypothetical protein
VGAEPEGSFVSAPINPVEVEQQMLQVLNRISNGIGIRGQLYSEFSDADREYDRQYALAYTTATGPAHMLKYLAELATSGARLERDVADAAYRDAERRAKALETELSALQTIMKSILASYGAAGVGER